MEKITKQNITKEFEIKHYINLILRGKIIIFLCIIFILLPVVYFVKSKPDTYFSSTQIVLENVNKANSGFYSTTNMFNNVRGFDFYEGIFRSRTFINEVLDSIGGTYFRKVIKDTSRNAMINHISSSVNLNRTKYRSFLNISAKTNTADLAYLLAEYSTNIFIKQCKDVVAIESYNNIVEIENQIVIIRRKLEEASREYAEYSDVVGGLAGSVSDELVNLKKDYFRLKTENLTREAEYLANVRQVNVFEKKLIPKKKILSKKQKREYYNLKKQLASKEKEKQRLESMGVSVSLASPVVKEINLIEKNMLDLKGRTGIERVNSRILLQWQDLRKVIAEQELKLDILKNKMLIYKNKIKEYKKKNPDELSQNLEIARLDRARKVYEDTYNSLIGSVVEAKMKHAAMTGGLKVIDKAYFPHNAMNRGEKNYYIIAILLGLIIGFILIFIRDFLDTTIKSTEEIENDFSLPVIGTIPHININKRNELEIKRRSSSGDDKEVSVTYPKELIDFYNDESIIAEAYRSFRTNLFFSSPDKPLRTVMLSSSGPHEGKSLSTSNLALACAQMGKKTLLIDCDLRRPVQHHLFKKQRENGFTDLFMGKDLSSVIKQTDMERLSIITAGQFTPNPSELIASKKLEGLIEEMKQEFDLILFDTPPIMAVTDAPLLSTRLDGSLMVVKSAHTDKNILFRSLNALTSINSNVIGVVLNDIDLADRYASSGYYKYYYHYYRSQKN